MFYKVRVAQHAVPIPGQWVGFNILKNDGEATNTNTWVSCGKLRIPLRAYPPSAKARCGGACEAMPSVRVVGDILRSKIA